MFRVFRAHQLYGVGAFRASRKFSLSGLLKSFRDMRVSKVLRVFRVQVFGRRRAFRAG